MYINIILTENLYKSQTHTHRRQVYLHIWSFRKISVYAAVEYGNEKLVGIIGAKVFKRYNLYLSFYQLHSVKIVRNFNMDAIDP